MSGFLDTLSTASSGMEAQQRRIRAVAENVANADTPGYRRKLVSFRAELDEGRVAVDRVSLDRAELREVHQPSHPMADARGFVRMSNVDLMTEIADSREAQRSYQANLSMFDQARRMYGGLLDLLRRS